MVTNTCVPRTSFWLPHIHCTRVTDGTHWTSSHHHHSWHLPFWVHLDFIPAQISVSSACIHPARHLACSRHLLQTVCQPRPNRRKHRASNRDHREAVHHLSVLLPQPVTGPVGRMVPGITVKIMILWPNNPRLLQWKACCSLSNVPQHHSVFTASP